MILSISRSGDQPRRRCQFRPTRTAHSHKAVRESGRYNSPTLQVFSQMTGSNRPRATPLPDESWTNKKNHRTRCVTKTLAASQSGQHNRWLAAKTCGEFRHWVAGSESIQLFLRPAGPEKRRLQRGTALLAYLRPHPKKTNLKCSIA